MELDIQIRRTQEEIDETLNKAVQGIDDGTAYPGMSYEQGLSDMYNWLTGVTDEDPMGDVELKQEQ